MASRVNFYHSMGEVPYWEQAAIGDSESLRGYPYNRFMDRTSLSWNLEMRTWVLEFPDYGIKLGGQLFTDFGRVFGREDDLLTDFFSDYKHTFGAGGAISLFSPDFILRGDLGFSEDMFRIYAGIGYVF
jgi:outer membrane protein assembly factor BamA